MPDTSANKAPVVSVVIPTHNRAPLLRTAIECIQAQSFTNWELLVMDDGSTDDTRSVVENMAVRDKRIAYYHQAHRGFPAPGLNRGLSLARGAFLFKFDDDDTVHCEYLDKCVAALRTHHACNMVKVGILVCGNRGDVWGRDQLPFFFRTSALRAVGGWNEFYQSLEDTDLIHRIEELGVEAHLIDDILYYYWQHGGAHVSQYAHALLNRYAITLARQYRAYGLPDFIRYGWSKRQVARFCYGQAAHAPYNLKCWQIAQVRSESYPMERRNFVLRNKLILVRLFSRLVQAHPVFPYQALWRSWQQILKSLHGAYYPVLWRFQVLLRAFNCYRPGISKAENQICITEELRTYQETSLRTASAKLAILLIADGSVADMQAALKALTEQSFMDWELLIGVPHGVGQDIKQFVRHQARREARICFLPFTQALGHNAMLDILRQKTKAAYFYLYHMGAPAYGARLAQAISYMEQHPKVVALSRCADTLPDIFRNHHAMRLVSIPDGGRGWEAVYLKEHLRLFGLACAQLDQGVDAPKRTPADESALRWGAWRVLILESIRRFMRAGLPDLVRQGWGVRGILGAYAGYQALFPHHMQWRLPMPDSWWIRVRLFWQSLLPVRHA